MAKKRRHVGAFNITFFFFFSYLYQSRVTHLLFIPEKIHIERLSSNDDVIIKSRLSLVVCSRLFARAPVYFRKWLLIRAAPSLSSREGRCLCLLSRYRKSSSTRTNFRGRGPPGISSCFSSLTMQRLKTRA